MRFTGQTHCKFCKSPRSSPFPRAVFPRFFHAQRQWVFLCRACDLENRACAGEAARTQPRKSKGAAAHAAIVPGGGVYFSYQGNADIGKARYPGRSPI